MNLTPNSPNITQIWEKLPWSELPLTAKVDFCQFLGGIKPAIRTHIQNPKYLNILTSLFQSFGWYSAYDAEGYIVTSTKERLSNRILEVDRDPFPHEVHLGTLLGYPKCCCEHIAKCGENKIDQKAQAFKRENLKEEFKLIDISLYDRGIALISHVPCSCQCVFSLQMAKLLKVFILSSDNKGNFLSWRKDIRNYFKF